MQLVFGDYSALLSCARLFFFLLLLAAFFCNLVKVGSQWKAFLRGVILTAYAIQWAGKMHWNVEKVQ